jgi:hypothetical protein
MLQAMLFIVVLFQMNNSKFSTFFCATAITCFAIFFCNTNMYAQTKVRVSTKRGSTTALNVSNVSTPTNNTSIASNVSSTSIASNESSQANNVTTASNVTTPINSVSTVKNASIPAKNVRVVNSPANSARNVSNPIKNATTASSPVKNAGNNYYAGIDIGSRGIKMTIIKMGKNAANTGAFTSIKDTSVNTDFISFTASSFTATAKGLINLYNVALNKYNIEPSRIFAAVSSGIKGQAEVENKTAKIADLIDSFKHAINEPQREVKIIDALEEAKLSHLGIVPESRRYTTFLIDIGSGNTKGGYFKNGNTKELKLFMLNWGTRTIANATEKRLDDDITMPNYKKQLTRVLAGDPNSEIIFAVNSSGAYNMNDNFAFSGGIAWASATLLFPELIDNSVVSVTYNDLVKLQDKIYNDYASLAPEKLSKNLTDKSVDKNAVALEVLKIQKVFDQKSLLSGLSLLINIVRQFEGTQEKKKFFLVKNGQVGWISAYVNKAIENENKSY